MGEWSPQSARKKTSNLISSTAVIHLYNGSTLDIGPIEALPEYTALLSSLAKAPAPPPLTKYEEFLRLYNKKLGRPSTPTVGVLARLIIDLKEKVQESLPDNALNRVVVTSPLLPALTALDINDALEYAGLATWFINRATWPRLLSESQAHFAGQGMGLCKAYDDFFQCWDEEYEMPKEDVYYVQ
jgi:hypothetical protein